MKKAVISAMSVSAIVLALFVQTDIRAGEINHVHVGNNGVALDGYCPVAYFAANKAIKGKKQFASEYQGVTYYFVNGSAMKRFQANPEKYLPEYGGYCAYAIGQGEGKKVAADPTNFKVTDGRLLLFFKNAQVDTKTLWNNGSESQQLQHSDHNWAAMTK